MTINKETIVQQYGKMVSALAHRTIRNKQVAQEAAQEVWLEILNSFDRFEGKSQLSTWVYTIAQRTIARYAQKERVATMPELKEFRDLPAVEYEGLEDEKLEWIKENCDKCLTSLNHCLNTEGRLIFTFRHILGLSYKEIAAIMEMEEPTVRKIASRATNKVSNFLKDTCSLYNPAGACKYRIDRHIKAVQMDREYASMRKMIRLADVYQRFEKELPRKNYWIKLLPPPVTE